MVRKIHWAGMLLLACTSVGCSSMYDCVDTTCYALQCEHRAKTAWMECRDLYEGVAFPYNFGEGFRDGYKAVCMGNDNGCAPPMPPRRYWSSCYLNCEGRAKAMAWYDGYAHGVLAASCGGCAGSCQIATNVGSYGSGELGTALKGYKPPMPPNYGKGNEPYGEGPVIPRPQPTPLYEPPADETPGRESLNDDLLDEGLDLDEEMVPEAPLAPPGPLEIRHQQQPPLLPAAEAYRVPVF